MSSKSLTGALIFTGSSVLLCARILMSRRSSTAVKMISTAAPDIEDCGKVICVKRGSIPTEVEAGKTYWYCTCGRSTKQPFCDGKHKGSSFKPVKYEATESKTVYFCGCKQGAKMPLCNGDHKKLPEDCEGKAMAPFH